MTWQKRSLRDDCTYWGPPILNEYGDRTYPSPGTMKCNWQEKAILFIDKSGAESHSHAVVLLAAEIEVGGRLYHGTSTETDPNDQSGADVIRQVERTRTIRGDVVSFAAIL